jgi:tetratricopeptide (TPR) repeat protein
MRRRVPWAAALLALLALLWWPETGSSRRGVRRGPKVPRTHVVYRWQERMDRLVIEHELNLYGNGYIRYSQRAGLGTPQETTLPNDRPFVQDVIQRFERAREAKAGHPPCGAPQGGELRVQRAHRTRRFDLSKPEHWRRYGALARRLIGRVVGAMPPPLEADCQPLKLRVDPSRVAAAPQIDASLPGRDQERPLLLRYGAATTPDARLRLLTKLARIREGDRFFRWALLRRHASSLAARRLVRRHAAALVRGVRSRPEARELLGYLGVLRTPEGLYHRALLRLVLERPKAAARKLRAFHLALNQEDAAKRAAKDLHRMHDALVDSHRRRPPWGRIRRAFPRLFKAWLDRAEREWAGDPAQAPPLALLLYRRALHYARLSALAPSIRTSTGGAATVRRARRLVKRYAPRLASGRWERHPYWHQKDLLFVTGYVRRHRSSFDKAWLAAHLDTPAETVCRMIRMRYFSVADRYVERTVEKGEGAAGALRHAQGRCLVERERYEAADRALTKAIGLGVPAARLTRVEALLDQGDLAGAARELQALRDVTPAAWRARSRLERLRQRPDVALQAARKAYLAARDPVSLVAVGRARALAGKVEGARRAYRRAAKAAGAAGHEARIRLVRLELAQGQPRRALKAAWPLTRATPRTARVAGHVLVARAAARLGMSALARLQIERARYHAGEDPRALERLGALLVEGGRGLTVALQALRRAQGRRPGWTRIHAQLALLYGQIRALPKALAAIGAALHVRPEYPPYRALERALVRLRHKGDE